MDTKGFFQFEVIINVSVIFFWSILIGLPMLWLYDYQKGLIYKHVYHNNNNLKSAMINAATISIEKPGNPFTSKIDCDRFNLFY